MTNLQSKNQQHRMGDRKGELESPLSTSRTSGYLFRHVTDIDHHDSDVVSLCTSSTPRGPCQHVDKQPLSKLFRGKILMCANELAQLSFSERLAAPVLCLD